MDLKGMNFKSKFYCYLILIFPLEIGKPRCLLMMRENISENQPLYERRFYFESLKLNYSCLDSEEEFKTIFTSIIQNHKGSSSFREFNEELTSLVLQMKKTLGDAFLYQRTLHGRIIDFLKSLTMLWQDADSNT